MVRWDRYLGGEKVGQAKGNLRWVGDWAEGRGKDDV